MRRRPVSTAAMASMAALTLLALPQLTLGQAGCTYWFQAEGYEFNLSPMQSNVGGWQELLDTRIVAFNFCGPVVGTLCGGSPAASMQLTGPNGKCAVSYGSYASSTWRLLNEVPTAGISITYPGGEKCSSGFANTNYSTVLNVACDPTVPENPFPYELDSIELANCELVLALRSRDACPYEKRQVVAPLGAGWIVFIVLVVVIDLYCIGGIVYKRYKFGSSGLEMIPHVELLRRAYGNTMQFLGMKPKQSAEDYFAVGGTESDTPEAEGI